ncbi:alpha/beta fold hydrolase [Pseudonocardia spinosispora]|uniref:alpha/beta fold hydrolase n=1 Tax=Pseudonocardia spinosispora TaxID=103441 RepID=UPI0004027759|nr:alpha/beta fold hydrolase [Pseudonocardia spinosispora]
MNRRGALLLAAGAVGVGAAVVAARGRARERSEHTTFDIPPDTPGHQGGSGTPILLLHGISVTWRTWKPILPLLEQHHEVFAPTLLGHSGAAMLPDGVEPSIDALVDGVEAELDSLGLDKVHVVGNSMGGWVALELARRGRARSVVVFSPAGGWSSNLRLAALVTGMRVGFDVLQALGPRAEALARSPRGRRMLVSAQVAHPERFDPAEVVADIRALRNIPVVRPLIKVLGQHPFEELPDPGCPVRVVWARKDKVIPFPVFGQPLVDKIPGAELLFLDDVGHVPMSDDPEAVTRLILEVTDKVDREAEQAGLVR